MFPIDDPDKEATLVWMPEGEKPIAEDFKQRPPEPAPALNPVLKWFFKEAVAEAAENPKAGQKPWIDFKGDVYDEFRILQVYSDLKRRK